MAKREPQPRDTKVRIMDAALAVFAACGYNAASIDEIAARAGVTKGAIYYYFKDKDDLARDLQQSLFERLQAEALRAVEPGQTIVESLIRSLDAYLAALQGLGVARFFLRDSYAVPVLEESARGQREAGTTALVAMLEHGMARGELVPLDAEATARVLVGAFSEATLHILTTGVQEPTREVIRRLVSSLGAPGGGGARRAAARARSKGPARC